MPVSQTAEYALRAVICLARHDDAQTTQHLAECTRVPQSYLPKVLQPLARAKIVSAQRGVRGGYTLEAKGDELTVLDVVNCVDPIKRLGSCPPGQDDQVVQALCPLHKVLDDAMGDMQKRFGQTTIAELAYHADGTPTRCGNLDTPPLASLEPSHVGTAQLAE